ncbi:MAG: DUF4253 domain-containing protein [Candidatus Melainabacteria bacterium]|nr:MAG: DUF4253 domain-containing protein [Candidatus Melainabacteria bacterium]
MRRFEYSAGGSDKFWEIQLDDNSFTVNYGRIGTNGLSSTKTFNSNQEAKNEHDKLVQEKLKKGYVEISGGSASTSPTKRSKDNLIAQLKAAGIDTSTFQRVSIEGGEDEDEESNRSDPADSFYMIDVSADKSFQTWKLARSLIEKTGYYPVITEDYDQLFEYMEFEDENDTAVTIKAALSANLAEFFKERTEELSDANDRERIGDWATAQEETASEDFYLVSRSGSDAILQLVFCPTKISWQVCAVLCWGNSNDGIAPANHSAVHRYWGTEYDAELVCITIDLMEFLVHKPPTTKEAAMKLAHEQFVYCPDIVHQGVQTVANLGKSLINSKKWFFWWD